MRRRIAMPVVDEENVARPMQWGLWFSGPGESHDDHVFPHSAVAEEMAGNFHRRECNRGRCRCTQYLPIEFQGVGATLLGDGRHIPHPGLVVIQIRRAHPEASIVVVPGSHAFQHLPGDVLGQVRLERRGIEHRAGTLQQHVQDPPAFVDVLRGYMGKNFFERCVIGGGAEKGMGCEQCAGAHSRDDVKLGARTAFPPTVEEARAKRAVLTATGYLQYVQRMTAHTLEVGDDTFHDIGVHRHGLRHELFGMQRVMPIGQTHVAW